MKATLFLFVGMKKIDAVQTSINSAQDEEIQSLETATTILQDNVEALKRDMVLEKSRNNENQNLLSTADYLKNIVEDLKKGIDSQKSKDREQMMEIKALRNDNEKFKTQIQMGENELKELRNAFGKFKGISLILHSIHHTLAPINTRPICSV